MKLVTFQSKEALKYLINNNELICNDNLIDKDKVGITYEWILKKMNQKIKNTTKSKYPLWVWVRCYNGICPPKRIGNQVKGFEVKITFNKDPKEVFITDFRRYSFLLNNIYIPDNLKDKEEFDKLLKDYNITGEDLKAYVRKDKYKTHRNDKEYLEICDNIYKSFDKCITEESDILQGCVWSIKLDEVESIEILSNKNYMYGSLNYIRSNGKRIDWQKDFYKKLN